MSVESVEVNGNQTIVKGDSKDIDEMFDFIKFETIADTKDVISDETEDDVKCSYVEDEENPDGALVYDSDSLADKIINVLPASNKGNVGLSGELTYSAEHEY